MKLNKQARRILTAVLCMITLAATLLISVYADDYDEDGMPIWYPDTNEIEGWPAGPAVYGETCLVMDAETGAILCSLEGETKRYPASTTKIMTALLTVENCSLDEVVTMTEEGTREVTAGDSSNAGTTVGEQFTVEECLYMLLLKSANDIANQLAVHVGGSIDNFAVMMNDRAAELGCTGTHFHNASGMPDEEHWTTAHDLARIMSQVLKNETLTTILGTTSHTVPATNVSGERYYENHNQLINPNSEYYYEYCIGGKTGFTNAAQRTLVTAARKDGHTLICVTMRTPDKSDYYDQRHLYDYAWDNFQWVDIAGGTLVLPSSIDPAPFKGMFPDYVDPDAPAVTAVPESGAENAPAADGNGTQAESIAISAGSPVAAAGEEAVGTGVIGEAEPERITISAGSPVAAAGEEAVGTGVIGEAAGTASLAEEPVQEAIPITRTVESGTPGFTAQETDYNDGRIYVRYYYKENPVGSAWLSRPMPEPESIVESVPEAAPEKSGTGMGTPLKIVLLILLLAAIAAVVFILLKMKRNLEAEREAARARRREARKNERETAWAGVHYLDDDSDEWDEPEDDEPEDDEPDDHESEDESV